MRQEKGSSRTGQRLGKAPRANACGGALRPLSLGLVRDPPKRPAVPQCKDKLELPTWRQPDGAPLSCVEKIKVLNENLEEIFELAQDALEDGILMGGDERQLREVLHGLVDRLENPYPDKTKV